MLLALPGLAMSAQVAPPGNAGVNQYLENVPAAGGNRPVPRGSTPRSPPGGVGRVAHDTLSRLEHMGREGSRAAHVAASGIPQPIKAGAGQAGDGTDAALVHAAEGSGTGMGLVLPLILAVAVAAAALVALSRRRRA